ncbi:uncharacterized protein LAESUDRAFT_91292 [Laetiporus sulphureus 93-53]|uniref:Uncharacterized protein n=1 Tax=Laetiporus sulphureus 93-53 TaxID=1314785 RepID=A0A165EYK9_9APHY|nr:uncharacterized protein LAESUDRAFT_91292 [Laetiporus sulphureus 93-53]KZT07989.1 hypothetical protein LAESUDRAFT_91292 [Laetiporus sulphureus 93-53]
MAQSAETVSPIPSIRRTLLHRVEISTSAVHHTLRLTVWACLGIDIVPVLSGFHNLLTALHKCRPLFSRSATTSVGKLAQRSRHELVVGQKFLPGRMSDWRWRLPQRKPYDPFSSNNPAAKPPQHAFFRTNSKSAEGICICPSSGGRCSARCSAVHMRVSVCQRGWPYVPGAPKTRTGNQPMECYTCDPSAAEKSYSSR